VDSHAGDQGLSNGCFLRQRGMGKQTLDVFPLASLEVQARQSGVTRRGDKKRLQNVSRLQARECLKSVGFHLVS
jgi:hypothetical protein